MDIEREGQGAPPVSAEVQDLIQRNKMRKAAKLYLDETGATMDQALVALKQAKQELGPSDH